MSGDFSEKNQTQQKCNFRSVWYQSKHFFYTVLCTGFIFLFVRVRFRLVFKIQFILFSLKSQKKFEFHSAIFFRTFCHSAIQPKLWVFQVFLVKNETWEKDGKNNNKKTLFNTNDTSIMSERVYQNKAV